MVKQTSTTDAQDNCVKETATNLNSNLNSVQVLPMTFEERYRMYMRCKKEELAKMLAARDEYDNLRQPIVVPNPYPSTYPWITCYTTSTATTVSSEVEY